MIRLELENALEIRRNSVTLAELDDLVAYLKNFD